MSIGRTKRALMVACVSQDVFLVGDLVICLAND